MNAPDKEIGAWLRDNEMLLYAMAGSALRRMGWDTHPQTTELVVADAMWRAWEYRHLYTNDGTGSLKAWMNTVVHSSCLELRRHSMRDKGRAERFVKALGFEGHTDGPEAGAMRRETIRETMGMMDAQARQAVYLKFMGYDYHEIAHEMSISHSMVHKALNRGRRAAKARND